MSTPPITICEQRVKELREERRKIESAGQLLAERASTLLGIMRCNAVTTGPTFADAFELLEEAVRAWNRRLE